MRLPREDVGLATVDMVVAREDMALSEGRGAAAQMNDRKGSVVAIASLKSAEYIVAGWQRRRYDVFESRYCAVLEMCGAFAVPLGSVAWNLCC